LNSKQFWTLVSESTDGTSTTKQLVKLERLLKGLSDRDAVGAYQELIRQENRAELHQVISAAFCFAYHFSDSSWINHKYWLVSRGEIEFELAITDPDSFYCRYYDEIKTHNIFFEEFYSCFEVDLDRRGIDSIDIDIDEAVEFSGEPVSDSDWPERFPKICEKKNQLGIDGWA